MGARLGSFGAAFATAAVAARLLAGCGGEALGGSSAGGGFGAGGDAVLQGGAAVGAGPGAFGGEARGGARGFGGGESGRNGGSDGAAGEVSVDSPETAGSEFFDISPEDYRYLLSLACKTVRAERAAPEFPVRSYLLETAGTMLRVAPGQRLSDWEFARSAVLSTMSSRQTCGLRFFPNRGTMPNFEAPLPVSACIDPVRDVGFFPVDALNSPGGVMIQEALELVFPQATSGAPMLDAFRAAWTEIRPVFSPSAWSTVVLLSDGQPTLDAGCTGSSDAREPVPTEPLLAEIATALDAGVRTFVVGTPGSEITVAGSDARPWLSAAARAGGTATFDCSDDGPNFCHFDLSTRLTTELPRAFDHTSFDAVSCTLLAVLDAFSEDERKGMNLFMETEGGDIKLIRRNDLSPCHYGWHFTDTTVELCPGTCDAVQRAFPRALVLIAPCGGIPQPPP